MHWTIFVENLILPARIGIGADEQGVTQPVRFSVQVFYRSERPPISLKQTVDYAAIIEHIQQLTGRHIDLAETYAAAIGTFVCTLPHMERAIIEVAKLQVSGAYGGIVGVRLEVHKP